MRLRFFTREQNITVIAYNDAGLCLCNVSTLPDLTFFCYAGDAMLCKKGVNAHVETNRQDIPHYVKGLN